jgi:Fe-S cluster assembly scaffold protein SufB
LTAGAPARPPRATTARAVRRGPADLPFVFPDRGLAQALAAERDEPAWLRDERLAAWTAYDALPVESNQLYTSYVDLRAADLFAARPYVRTADASTTTGDIGNVPDDLSGIIELREDGVATIALSAAARRAGVVIETLGAALGRDEAGFRAQLEGGATLPPTDKLAMLTRAFWSQGIRLVIPDGAVLDAPFVLRWLTGAPDRALLSRTFVTLGRGARAGLVEELGSVAGAGAGGDAAVSAGEGQALYTGTLEVDLAAGAELRVASIQDFGPRQVVFQHRQAAIGEGAKLHWALAQLGGRLVRSRVGNHLEGDRSSVEQVEIVFGSDEQLFDLTSYTRHVGRDTTGNLLSKGVLLDAARSYMKGMITIDKTAIGTDSFLGEFGMNLSKKTRSVAIPSLEIDQPDCRRAMHSSSVGPIDESQLFYLESRGIPPDEARKFIVLGFLEPVVTRVPLEAERDRLRELLEAKWNAGLVGAAAA